MKKEKYTKTISKFYCFNNGQLQLFRKIQINGHTSGFMLIYPGGTEQHFKKGSSALSCFYTFIGTVFYQKQQLT